MLDSRNPEGTNGRRRAPPDVPRAGPNVRCFRRGIYDVAPELPLQLMVDLKSDVRVSVRKLSLQCCDIISPILGLSPWSTKHWNRCARKVT